MCRHQHFIRHGFTRGGRQRYRCTSCRKSWSEGYGLELYGARWMGNRISDQNEQRLAELISQGLSIRAIRSITPHGSITIQRRMAKAYPKVRLTKAKAGHCDHCGKCIDGEREFYRKTKRTKHKFCCHQCFGDYYRSRRAKDRCTVCKRMRREMSLCAVFSNGMCAQCYALSRKE